MDFKANSQLLIIYSAFVKYLRKNGNTTKQCVSFLDFKKAYDSVRGEVMYNILIESVISMIFVRLTKMCLKETYCIFRVSKKLPGTFRIRIGLKQGGVLSPLFFNFPLQYTTRRVQVNQDGFILNGTHQLLVWVDDVNIMRGSVHTVKGNAEDLIMASKEIGLEVNPDKIKYMVMSRDQNERRNHNIKTFNCSFERV